MTSAVWEPKIPLRPYQEAAVRWLIKQEHGALLLDTRLGKTKVSIDWLSYLARNEYVDNIVIICPKIACSVWHKEIENNWWGNDQASIYDLRRVRDKQSPNRKKRWPSKTIWNLPGKRIVIVNIERFSAESADIVKGIHSLEYDRSAVILDESHMIKTPASKRSRKIVQLGKAFRYRAILTATPVTKRGRIDEVYPQWCFMDPSTRDRWPSAKDFREYFAEWDNKKGYPEFKRPLHTAEYAELISSQSIALTRLEALGMDDVRHYPHVVNLDPVADALYNGLTDDPEIFEVHNIEPPQHIFAKFALSRRIAGGVIPQGDSALVTSHKINKAISLLTDKTIICCNFIKELEAVSKAIKNRPVFVVSGKTKDKTNTLEQFRTSDKAVLVVQPSVVAVAVDLACANRVIWLGIPTDWVTFKQMTDRIALNPCHPESHAILAHDTTDISLYHSLLEAKSYRSDLLAKPIEFLKGQL